MRFIQGVFPYTAAVAVALSQGCNFEIEEEPESCAEFVYTESRLTPYDGVDILMAVDSTGALEPLQDQMTTGMLALINTLTLPPGPTVDPDWDYPPISNVRFAVVTSDMGLQWGEEFDEVGNKVGGNTGGNATEIPGCGNDTGQNGTFAGPMVTTIEVKSNVLRCEEGGGQCPEAFGCEDNRCVAPNGIGTVNCPVDSPGYQETTGLAPNPVLATQAACLVLQGDDGCRVGQPLEALARGLENDAASDSGFLVRSHLLALLVVSEEDDCSIRDSGLFDTPEWTSGTVGPQTACSFPPENEVFLFPSDSSDVAAIVRAQGTSAPSLRTYHDRFIELKGGDPEAVLFGAVVGVPNQAVDGQPDLTCQADGVGLAANGCLDHPDMAQVDHACVLTDDTGVESVIAVLGRRFVKTAQTFGANGYVTSICNEDWTPAMRSFAAMIARQIRPACFGTELDWVKNDKACDNCGRVETCDVIATIEQLQKGPDPVAISCPASLYEGLTAQERIEAEKRTVIEDVTGSDGTVIGKVIHCPLPKLYTPRDCAALDVPSLQRRPGWYYCESVAADETCPNRIHLTGAASAAVQGRDLRTRCSRSYDVDGGVCQ